MSILPSSSTAVPFAQGQDVSRLRAAVDMSSQEIKDYLQEDEDQRVIVEALPAAEQAEPGNKSKIDILGLRERRLEAARLRETSALSLLANCLIADSNAVQTQAASTAATATPTVAITTPFTTILLRKRMSSSASSRNHATDGQIRQVNFIVPIPTLCLITKQCRRCSDS